MAVATSDLPEPVGVFRMTFFLEQLEDGPPPGPDRASGLARDVVEEAPEQLVADGLAGRQDVVEGPVMTRALCRTKGLP
jgi:hypothetical protein